MCLTIPAKVIKVSGAEAEVDFLGKKEKINCQLIKAKKGDYVMVSNGFAVKKISKKEAKEILKILKEEK